MRIAAKGTIAYEDDFPRKVEDPVTFEEMIERLNSGRDKFRFEMIDEPSEPTLLIVIIAKKKK